MQNSEFFDLGLPADLAMWARTPVARRRILRLGVAGIGVLLAGCATQTSTTSDGAPAGAPAGGGSAPVSAATRVSSDGKCVEVPTETNGPYPADGSSASSQTLNVLTRSGIVRSNLLTSINTKNVAPGVPAMLELTLININNACAPLSGYAVYVWHCNRAGEYSMYSQGVTDEDYLRGVQATDALGKVTFQTIFPACYSGRWPHIHFEVYPSIDKATGPSALLHTSQVAIPKDACDTVYASADGYSASVANLSQVTLATDNVFSDTAGVSQLATTTGSIADGFTFKLTAGVYV